MKFKGKAFGNIVRMEFDILTLGELKIDDLRDFDTDSIKIELKPTSSGIKVIGIWEGTIQDAGEGIRRALEESYRLRERILNRIKSKTEAIRSTMQQLGFKEEVEGYGSVLRFTKNIGAYEVMVIASTTEDLVRVEVYGNDRKIISPRDREHIRGRRGRGTRGLRLRGGQGGETRHQPGDPEERGQTREEDSRGHKDDREHAHGLITCTCSRAGTASALPLFPLWVRSPR